MVEQARADTDDLDVLALMDGRDHAGRRHLAEAERACHRGPQRGAAAVAADDAVDVDAGLLEEALLDCDRERSAGRVALVLGDQDLFRFDGDRRSQTETENQKPCADL